MAESGLHDPHESIDGRIMARCLKRFGLLGWSVLELKYDDEDALVAAARRLNGRIYRATCRAMGNRGDNTEAKVGTVKTVLVARLRVLIRELERDE
jgi:hypothetical protein